MIVPPKWDAPAGEIRSQRRLRKGPFKGDVGALDGTLINTFVSFGWYLVRYWRLEQSTQLITRNLLTPPRVSFAEMGSYDGALDVLLTNILSVIKPVEEDIRARHQVINEFRSVVACTESLRGAIVVPFGSFVSNLYTRWGDLDISIEMPTNSQVSSIGRKRKQNLLRDLMKALRKRGVAHNIQFISNARVPLLIFESNLRSISCDISISNQLGQIKSKLFLWISEIDERFRDMILLVKEWAKTQNINSPKTGTLNSYSLALLVIFHFQTCEPPILPPLQEIYVRNIADDLTGVKNTEGTMKDICARNIAKFRANTMDYINRSTLAELFISFLKKFSRINAMASQYAICTYTGKWEHSTSKETWIAKSYSLIIEDPFDQTDNAARSVGKNELLMIREAFEGSFRKLSDTQEQGSLINSLVRPHIRSQFYVRSQGNPNLSSTAQNQYQGMPWDTSSNIFLQRQQSSDSVHPVSNHYQNVRFGTHQPTAVSSQGRPYSSTSHPIQNRYENRPMEPTLNRRMEPALNRRMESTSSQNVVHRSGVAIHDPGQPESVVYRSGLAVHGQGQQIWRPRNFDIQ
ncbi:Poly(A) RNA polymerase GLD2-A [Thalictrum thalictroides]|uniref:Poly(A) RNA polymerase GLD2-A n=1 Tax=Thalictrum thalictroides TaxID=46969 RepID=A0A7J6WWY4_THATH|nr:Poly(A) RNA polymerase GLD2-A [Thalictrum thalictroides]